MFTHRVLYKPGPVPPGLEVPLTIEFTAATPGAFHGEIVVKGEVNVLTLTVDALVEEPAAPPPAATAAATEEPLEEAVA
jgi:CRISPR-associated protein Cas5t